MSTGKGRREDHGAPIGEGNDEAHGETLPVSTGWQRLTSDALDIVEDAFDFLDKEFAKDQEALRKRERWALCVEQPAAPMVGAQHAQVLIGAPASGQTVALASACPVLRTNIAAWPLAQQPASIGLPAQPSASLGHPAQPSALTVALSPTFPAAAWLARPSASIAHPPHQPASIGRTLNEAAVVFIFQQKLLRPHDPSLSARLAHQFGVTAKTVRDIWTLRTWTRVTQPYWTADHRQWALARPMHNS